jgi:hypothetical protein
MSPFDCPILPSLQQESPVSHRIVIGATALESPVSHHSDRCNSSQSETHMDVCEFKQTILPPKTIRWRLARQAVIKAAASPAATTVFRHASVSSPHRWCCFGWCIVTATLRCQAACMHTESLSTVTARTDPLQALHILSRSPCTSSMELWGVCTTVVPAQR